jgi:hypothetical protein
VFAGFDLAHAAFGEYKQSGFGRETYKMILDHDQQTKNLLVSYSPKALGFFQTARKRMLQGGCTALALRAFSW